jgi:signal transduction histidine kinase
LTSVRSADAASPAHSARLSPKELDTGEGNGLSLSISYIITQRHGGTITLDSRVWLPRAAPTMTVGAKP